MLRFCNHIVTRLSTAANKKNGQVLVTSRRRLALVAFPERHHAQSNNATGKNTTCVFESNASRKKTRDATYAVAPPSKRFPSISKKQKVDNKAKNIDRRFFSSEIQATDSAWTG